MLAALLTNLPSIEVVVPPVVPLVEPPPQKIGGGFIRPKKARKLKLKIDPREKTELFEGKDEEPPRIAPPVRIKRTAPSALRDSIPSAGIDPLARVLSARLSVPASVIAIRGLRKAGVISESDEEEALMIILLSL